MLTTLLVCAPLLVNSRPCLLLYLFFETHQSQEDVTSADNVNNTVTTLDGTGRSDASEANDDGSDKGEEGSSDDEAESAVGRCTIAQRLCLFERL